MIAVERTRLEKLRRLLDLLWLRGGFHRERWLRAGLVPGLIDGGIESIDDFHRYPLTCRRELAEDQRLHPPLGTARTLPGDRYRRLHRSSGTTGAPLLWADTERSWRSLVSGSAKVYHLAGIGEGDRFYQAGSFGSSLGPWIIREGAARAGALVLACGRPGTLEELRILDEFRPTVIAGSPAALQELGAELAQGGRGGGGSPTLDSVRKIILSGRRDDGRSAAIRARIERLWGAATFDRYGLTEAGSVAGECAAHPGGLHLLEERFIAEVVDPATGDPLDEGAEGELVLTTLAREASPIVRYRTGDLVRLRRDFRCACGRIGTFLEGGVRAIEVSAEKNVAV